MLAKADVFEEAGDYVVEVELPGAIADSVEIFLDDAVLTIRGLRSPSGRCAGRTYFRRERKPGPFERHIPLPGPVWSDYAEASRRDGLLVIRIPKKNRAVRKFVPVPVRNAG
jgi:HSP20 family protein